MKSDRNETGLNDPSKMGPKFKDLNTDFKQTTPSLRTRQRGKLKETVLI